MAQEIRTFTWCDPCLDQEEHQVGSPVVLEVSIGGAKPTRLEADLCEVHRKDLEAVVDTLLQVGRKPSDYVCQVTGCGRTFATQQGLSLHIRRSHPQEQEALIPGA